MTREEAFELISDCEARERKLSSWEHDFIVSLRDQLEADPGYKLSPLQEDKLNETWEKVT